MPRLLLLLCYQQLTCLLNGDPPQPALTARLFLGQHMSAHTLPAGGINAE